MKPTTTIFHCISLMILIALTTVNCCDAQFHQDSILKRYKYVTLTNIAGNDVLVWKKNNRPKPSIIFITGSGFTPLFVNGGFIGIPFNLFKYLDHYNILVAAKPGVPTFDDSLSNPYLNANYPYGAYLDKNGTLPPAFIKNNNNDYYVQLHSKIIDFINKQSWAQKNHIIIIGHSQGTHAAATVALKNKSVGKVILMSPGSPLNRFHEFIQQIRQDELFGTIDPKTAQAKVDSIYTRHLDLLNNKNDDKKSYDGLSYHAYYSFVYPGRDKMILALRQKTLVVYGTASLIDRDCDYLKLLLDAAGKTNVEIKAYPGYDHNYFEDVLNTDGSVKDKLYHWDDVMEDVTNWIQKS